MNACHSEITVGKEMLKGQSLTHSISMLSSFIDFSNFLGVEISCLVSKRTPRHCSDSWHCYKPKRAVNWRYISCGGNSRYLRICYIFLVCSCMGCLQKLKREHAILRQKLESYFQVTFRHHRVMTIHHPFPVPPRVLMDLWFTLQLLRQAGPAGAATRPVM